MKIFIQKAHGHAKRHYEKHYKTRYQERAHLVFLLDAALVTIALSLLGLAMYFRFGYHPLRDDFRLMLLTEQTIVAGEETRFIVRVANDGKMPIHDALLNVRLPNRFISTQLPESYDPVTKQLQIGDIAAESSLDYVFHGTILGLPQASEIFVRFAAKNENGQSDELLTKGTLRWGGNAVITAFELPQAVVPGQTTTFRLRVKNGSAFAFDKAVIRPSWPAGFRVQKATPPVYRDTIALGKLEPGEEVFVDVSGRFNGLADIVEFDATLSGDVNGELLDLSGTSATVRVAAVDLKLAAVFDPAAPAIAQPGDEIPVIVRYRNEGLQTIKDLKLAIAPEVNTLGDVRWETSNRIASLGAGEQGERKAFVRVRETISRYAVNPVFRATPQAVFSIDDPKVIDAHVGGTAVETKIAGTARLRAVARYYTSEGDQLGRGPLPPRVGKTTRYWIFASLETGATQTTDGFVSFRLPPNVAWTERAAVTVGQDLVLEGDRLVWRLGATDPHAGILHEAPSASFEVALTPTAEQAGSAPLLLSAASYTGQDSWTNTSLTSTQAGLTTQLPNDSGVAGRTQVRP
jgi:hypothetical protein